MGAGGYIAWHSHERVDLFGVVDTESAGVAGILTESRREEKDRYGFARPD